MPGGQINWLLDEEELDRELAGRIVEEEATMEALYDEIDDNIRARDADPKCYEDTIDIRIGYRKSNRRQLSVHGAELEAVATEVYEQYKYEVSDSGTYEAATGYVQGLEAVYLAPDSPLGYPHDLHEKITISRGMTIVITCAVPGVYDVGTLFKVLGTHDIFIICMIITGEDAGAACIIRRVVLGVGSGAEFKRCQMPVRICNLYYMIQRFGPLCLSEEQYLATVAEEKKFDEDEAKLFIDCPVETSEFTIGSDEYFCRLYLEKYSYVPNCPKYFVMSRISNNFWL